ncbi:MAG: hypothetical protein A2166_06460 [Omnitrophica WOR_2 bacterium RBG_13_41_10]|nr:MAG: hypothetical protein A2166_06460 [Omnitrophica WOR_2 bacterium RBG_13_41_10]
MYHRHKIIFDWVFVVSVYLFTLSVIPLSDKLLFYRNSPTSGSILNAVITLLLGSVFLGILIYLIKQNRKAGLSAYIWLTIFFIISAYFLIKVRNPSDRLHFLGYGILSLLLYRALRHNIGTKILYLWTSIFIMLFAVLDETLQIFGAGDRSFEIKDIFVDWLSSLIGQLVVALVIRPKLEAIQIKIRRYAKDTERSRAFKSHSRT